MRDFSSRVVVLCFCIAVCCATSQSASPTTGILMGKVVDSYEHAPIRRTLVLMHKSGDVDRTAETDNQGRFSVEAPAGVYDVFVSSEGFDPTCRKLKVRLGKTFVYNVELKANTLGMEDQ